MWRLHAGGAGLMRASTLLAPRWSERIEISIERVHRRAELFWTRTAGDPDDEAAERGERNRSEKEEDRSIHERSPDGAGRPTSSISRASRPQLSPSDQTSRFQIGAVAFSRSIP